MARRRMFSLDVTDTDLFMDMSSSAQALYFHLGMHGDDDGFVSSPKRIVRAAGCNDDDLRLLIAKGFLIAFENGVVVITDWQRNNTLKNDRYHPTEYLAEKNRLCLLPSGKYSLGAQVEPDGFQIVSNSEPEHNLTKHNLTNLTNEHSQADKPPKEKQSFPPSVEEVRAYCRERGNNIDPETFIAHYTASGWMRGKTKIKDWRACVVTWEKKDKAAAGHKVCDYDYDGEDTL